MQENGEVETVFSQSETPGLLRYDTILRLWFLPRLFIAADFRCTFLSIDRIERLLYHSMIVFNSTYLRRWPQFGRGDYTSPRANAKHETRDCSGILQVAWNSFAILCPSHLFLIVGCPIVPSGCPVCGNHGSHGNQSKPRAFDAWDTDFWNYSMWWKKPFYLVRYSTRIAVDVLEADIIRYWPLRLGWP